MSPLTRSRSTLRVVATGAGLAASAYAAYAAAAWWQYGRAPAADVGDSDDLLDRYMPAYDVVERHRIDVAAPAAITFLAAKEQDLLQSPLVRAIFRTRELMLGATRGEDLRHGLLESMQSLGWGILHEVAGREVVVGAVTRPWEANVRFHALPPEEFAAFAGPGYVKIAWTLRADLIDDHASVFRTETRAVATDISARVRFRRYWALVSPGVAMIRRLSLRPLKRDAERRARNEQSARSGAS